MARTSDNRKRSPAEPKILEARQLWPDEEFRVALEPFRGQWYFSARRWFRDKLSGEFRPGRGLSLNARHIPLLKRAILAAERAALDGDLLDDCDYEVINELPPAELRAKSA